MSGSHSTKREALLSNKSYDNLKASATLVLPAVGALYFTLAQIWQLPYGEQVVGTVAAVNTLLGVILGVSSKSYNKNKYDGVIEVEVNPSLDGGPKKTFSLNFNGDPEDIEKMTDVTFKVDKTSPLLKD